MKTSSRIKLAAVLSLAGVGLVSLIEWSAAQSLPPGFFPLQMSLNRLMVAVVDDAAHGIWEGGNKEETLTDLEWVEIEMNTYQLEAAATLVSLGGTGPADQGWVNSPRFQEAVRKLGAVAVTARNAVTNKNKMALRTAGDTLVDVCTDCHDVFKPGIPTEGILLKRGHSY